MRHDLGLSLTFAAVTYLALGCQTAGNPTGGVGGGGGGGGRGVNSGGTSGPSSGAGGGTVAGTETTPASMAGPDKASCEPGALPADPIFLSVAHARSTVSATQVRGVLADSNGTTIPLPSLIRGPELLSYFHIDYPSALASAASPLNIVTELVATDVPRQLLLQIGVQAPRAAAHRDHTVLTVLVDTSKSMEGESMKRANAAVLAMAASLNQGDVLNLLTTDEGAKAVHRIAASDGDPALFQGDPPLAVGGAGNLEAGLDAAYTAARATDSYTATGINRVVVITDGGGLVTTKEVQLAGSHWAGDGIQLVGVGVGAAAGYRRELLDAMTHAGHGANLYLDSAADADVALHQRFDEVMDEAAGDLSISVTVPPMFEVVNADASGQVITEAQLTRSDLGRGRSMVFRHAVTACPNLDSSTLDTMDLIVTASWTERGSADRQTTSSTISVAKALAIQPSYAILKTSAIQAFASALASLQVSRFQDACAKVTLARKRLQLEPNAATDHELDAILAQITSHPVMKGQLCQ